MKTYNLLLLLLLVLLSACQKEGSLVEEQVAKRITLQYFSLSGTELYEVKMNNRSFADSLHSGALVTNVSTDEKQHLVINDKITDKKVMDTTINTPGNKTHTFTLLKISNEPDAVPQLLQANAVDPASQKVNFVFYFDNTSGLFPQRIALKVIRYNLDPNTYDLDGTTDTLAALNPVLPGKIAVPLSIDIADDPFLPVSALSIYTMELRNADTGQLLSGGQFDVSTFSSSIYGFYNFDPNIRNYIISVTATPGIPNDVIAGNAVLSY